VGASGTVPERATAAPAADGPAPLFQRLLGERALAALPARVQRIHRADRSRDYAGQAQVTRGTTRFSRLCGRLLRLPPDGLHPLSVRIAPGATGERWTRRFGPHRLASALSARGGCLVERIGPVALAFRLAVREGTLRWVLERVRVAGLPIPCALLDVNAREYVHAGRYRFEVTVRLPRGALLIAYAGWLDVD